MNKSFAESLKGVLADPVFWAGVSVASGFWLLGRGSGWPESGRIKESPAGLENPAGRTCRGRQERRTEQHARKL